jgi:hypothetical protein
MNDPLDTRNPIHAKAIILAAGHFLSKWPQDWDAETLMMALVDEDSPNQCEVLIWQPIKNAAGDNEDPYLYVSSLIDGVAEDMIDLLDEYLIKRNSFCL